MDKQYLSAADFKGSECDYQYLVYLICYHAAPTLFGYKPANMICFKNTAKHNMRDAWHRYQHRLNGLSSICYFELSDNGNSCNVLFYRFEWLERIINKPDIKAYLSRGIEGTYTLDTVLCEFTRRFARRCPHDIGLLLGYPLSDVIAFKAKCDNCLCVGYWKVYSNIKRAQICFALYDYAVEKVQTGIVNSASPHHYLAHAAY